MGRQGRKTDRWPSDCSNGKGLREDRFATPRPHSPLISLSGKTVPVVTYTNGAPNPFHKRCLVANLVSLLQSEIRPGTWTWTSSRETRSCESGESCDSLISPVLPGFFALPLSPRSLRQCVALAPCCLARDFTSYAGVRHLAQQPWPMGL